MMFFAKYLVLFLLETDIETGVNLFYILAIGQMTNSWSGPVGTFLLMSGNERINQNTSIILAILFIILNTILVSCFGIIGSAIAVSFIMILQNIIYVIIIKMKYDILFLYIPTIIKKHLTLHN